MDHNSKITTYYTGLMKPGFHRCCHTVSQAPNGSTTTLVLRASDWKPHLMPDPSGSAATPNLDSTALLDRICWESPCRASPQPSPSIEKCGGDAFFSGGAGADARKVEGHCCTGLMEGPPPSLGNSRAAPPRVRRGAAPLAVSGGGSPPSTPSKWKGADAGNDQREETGDRVLLKWIWILST